MLVKGGQNDFESVKVILEGGQFQLSRRELKVKAEKSREQGLGGQDVWERLPAAIFG